MSRAENKHSIVGEGEDLDPFVPPFSAEKAILAAKIRIIRKKALTPKFRERLEEKDKQRAWEKLREISRRSPVEG